MHYEAVGAQRVRTRGDQQIQVVRHGEGDADGGRHEEADEGQETRAGRLARQNGGKCWRMSNVCAMLITFAKFSEQNTCLVQFEAL